MPIRVRENNPVSTAKTGVYASQTYGYVCYASAFEHFDDAGDVAEGGGAGFVAFGFVGAVADDVVDDFAAWGFEGAEGFAGWNAAGGAGADVAWGEVVEPFDAAGAGVDGFEDADDDASGDVAHVGGADFPVFVFAFFVGGARLGVTDVPVDVGGAGGGAGGAEGLANLGAEDADAKDTVKNCLFFQNQVQVVVHSFSDFF